MTNISVLVPSWNRRSFLPLLLRNLKIQDYPHDKIEVIIDDDGTEKMILDEELDEIKDHLFPMKLKYINNKSRRSIGKKRNDLIKSASSKIIAFMDDDDIYFPTYISHSYKSLKENKVGCVGSTQMIFSMSCKDYDCYMINCGDKVHLIHEATIMMTKKWYKASCGFHDCSEGEGQSLFHGMEKQTHITDIQHLMCCLQHEGNTINKKQFADEEHKIDIQMDEQLKIVLNNILKIK